MKNLLLIGIIGIFNYQIINAQTIYNTTFTTNEVVNNKYVFDIVYMEFIGDFDTGRAGDAWFEVTIHAGGSTKRAYYRENYVNVGTYHDIQRNILIPVDEPVTNITVNGSAADYWDFKVRKEALKGFPDFYTCSTSLCTTYTDIQGGHSEESNRDRFHRFFEKDNLPNDLDAYQGYRIHYRLLPLHYITSTTINKIGNTYLAADDKIVITDRPGFPVDTYNYQYSTDGFNWKNINSSLIISNKLSISARDLFGDNYINYVGQKIRFRVVSCLNDNNGYDSKSNVISLTVVPSAPHIISQTIDSTKCFDTSDGSIVLTFDRKLYPNERVDFLLQKGLFPYFYTSIDTLSTGNDNLSIRINNLSAGRYRLNLIGTYSYNNGISSVNTFTDGSTHSLNFTIAKPTPVNFTIAKTNINCFEGSDGSITISATGGKGKYQYTLDKGITWVDFARNPTHKIEHLTSGTYTLKVRDTNQCIAKGANGDEKEEKITISQPASALSLPSQDIIVVQPTGYGLSNGYIVVRITGGTPNADGSYRFEWRKGTPNGELISSNITTDAVNNPFTIKLDQLTAGKYYLTVKDKNYLNDINQTNNCGILSKEFIVTQPDSLLVSISLEKCISCNIANEYDYKADKNDNNVPDEAEDAVVKATVKGGITPYTYQWQVKNGAVFVDISGAEMPLLENLTQGSYRVLVTDKNNNTSEAELFVPYPQQLKIALTGSELKCNEMNNGQISVTATGGQGSYTYEWNTMDSTPIVNGLSAGNYFVLVRDEKQCAVKGITSVKQPVGMEIADVLVTNPFCFDGNNGAINIRVSGGVSPYIVQWSNGMQSESISGLKAGTYTVTLTDANGCSAFKTYTLTQPDEFKINLGDDITLCDGDSKVYDIKIDDPDANYRWTNQAGEVISSASSLSLSEAGVYTASVTTSKGCVASDNIEVRKSAAVLRPEFMITTHAFTNKSVILVNTSSVKPERVEWVIPEDTYIQVLNKTAEYLELVFTKAGNYTFGLKGFQGDCDKTFYKQVLVEDNLYRVDETPEAISNIKEFAVSPNPNKGKYEVIVKLHKAAPITIRIVSINSQSPYPAVNHPTATSFNIPVNYTLIKGIYLVSVQIENEMRVIKMVVN